MTAAELLRDLWRRGFSVVPKEGQPKLLVRPAERLSEADCKAIRALKPELLTLLSDRYEHAKTIACRCEATETDLVRYLAESSSSLLNEPSLQSSPAESLLRICERYCVKLCLDADGNLLVGRAGTKSGENGYAWPSLLRALEAHGDGVAALVKSGWTLKAEFTREQIAA